MLKLFENIARGCNGNINLILPLVV